MICIHCGADIPDGELVCPKCKKEVQIVPDYNPLEDVLAREVRGSVEGATRPIRTEDIRRYRREDDRRDGNSTRVLSQNELDRIRNEHRQGARNATSSIKERTSESAAREREDRRRTGEIRRDRRQKRLEAAKKKRRNLLITLFCVMALIAAGIYIAYQNSYTGMVKKGYRALQTKDYAAAEKYFDRAIIKDKSKPEAYTGYAEIYTDQGDMESAEKIFLSAIETQPSNAALYQAAIAFYMDTEQPGKISILLKDCEDGKVLDSVREYIAVAPDFTPDEGTYSEVQQVTLSSSTQGEIYYTLDGSDPTPETGSVYTEPILLQTEGEVEIRAIVINGKGIPSVAASRKYIIEFPIEDAPAVTPSTGQYTGPEQITITVPEGYTAYYTMDGTDPTTASEQYTGPINMPENARTIFKAVLVNNQNGKLTEVTTRSYISASE